MCRVLLGARARARVQTRAGVGGQVGLKLPPSTNSPPRSVQACGMGSLE